MKKTAVKSRPQPPAALMETHDEQFVPDHEFRDWIVSTFIDDAGHLHNPDHQHLRFADIGVLWTNVDNSRNMRTVIGQAELMPPMAMGKWQRARAEQQIADWFDGMPTFVLTFHAKWASIMDDASFCALVEHELYHCAQKTDDHGQPKFTQAGLPSFGIRGHDVEEFVGVVARYGPTAEVSRMVEAALGERDASRLDVARACGTCHLKAA